LRTDDSLLAQIDAHQPDVEEISIEDVDVDDPAFESLLVGRKVKVLLQDVDLIRWRQDLIEDRNRLGKLLSAATEILPKRDKKLEDLRAVIEGKLRNPTNPGNRKIIVFTAFADTAQYLYGELAGWLKATHGIESALVTGTGCNKTTLTTIRTDLASILTSFSPRSKERGEEFAAEGEIDLLIATDCISEGQNLQDCDFLINYDIHLNPVRIIQRFGRIDRIGSPNARIQLVNFWPNIELEEYINLEQRVSGRMVLLDISATGEENLIEQQSGNQMNDLEYRRKQLLKLQDAVIDLEDLGSGVSIADLTLTDFRIELAGWLKEHEALLANLPLGTFAATTSNDNEHQTTCCPSYERSEPAPAAEPRCPLTQHRQSRAARARPISGSSAVSSGPCSSPVSANRSGRNRALPLRPVACLIASVQVFQTASSHGSCGSKSSAVRRYSLSPSITGGTMVPATTSQ